MLKPGINPLVSVLNRATYSVTSIKKFARLLLTITSETKFKISLKFLILPSYFPR